LGEFKRDNIMIDFEDYLLRKTSGDTYKSYLSWVRSAFETYLRMDIRILSVLDYNSRIQTVKNVLDLKDEKNTYLIDDKDKKKITDEFGEDGSKLIKEFRQNISKLFDILLKEAKKIKDKAEKDREAEAEKLN
jgi:hypothetical protein